MSITIGGKTYDVPGSYGTIEVVNSGSVALPVFNNLLIIGGSKKGIPFNATGKTGSDVIKGFSSINSMKEFYGVSDITDAAEYAKKGGAGVIYAVNIASLTSASLVLKDNEASPADAMKLVPRDKYYGAAGNDISLSIGIDIDENITYTITPPKFTKFLTADASTSSSVITLENVEGLYVGQSIVLVDNSNEAQTVVIESINGNTLELDHNASSAFATSAYARIFAEDTDNSESKIFASTANIYDIIDWINSGEILTASRESYTGKIPNNLTKSYLQDVTGSTLGTSPDATTTVGGSYDSFAESAMQLLEEFTNYTKVRIRLLNVLSPLSTVHAVYRALALELRNAQNSVQVISGVASGDIAKSTSDGSHPIQRAKGINSADFILAGMGIDGKAAYSSLAPMVAGMMSANSVKRNLTNDAIAATTVEKTFGEFNKETETANYLRAGVLIVGTGKNGYYIVQGVNTYQNHSLIWNEDDDCSYLIQQMQIVDYVYEGYKTQMDLGVGADGYGPDIARVQGSNILKSYYDGGFITDYRIAAAWQEGNAVKTRPEITPLDAVDFVGFEMQVIIDD